MATAPETSSSKSTLPVMSLDEFFQRHPLRSEPPEQQQDKSQAEARVDEEVVLAGNPRCSEATVRLHELCQKRHLQPEFLYDEFQQQKFGVTLKLSGLAAGEQQVFTSPQYGETVGHSNKQLAKEAVSKIALQSLEQQTSRKRSSISMQDGEAAPADASVNWMGMLLEYLQAKHEPPPQFYEHAVGQGFTCEVIMGSRTLGDKSRLFSTKKAARFAAARAAVEHLEAQGESVRSRPTKRLRSTLSDGNGNETANKYGRAPNYIGLVSEACSRMRIAQPEWRLKPHDTSPSFFSCGAVFVDGKLGVPADEMIGEVRNMLGKKRAKAESAKEVYAFLMEFEQSRRRRGSL